MTFMVPPPPTIGDYTWNILEPEILKQDFGALMHTVGRTEPLHHHSRRRLR